MKKLTIAAANRFQKSRSVTIGLDLGDRSSHYFVLDESGRILTESKTATINPSHQTHCSHCPLFRRWQSSLESIAWQ